MNNNPQSFEQRLSQLNAELTYFNPLIGGWPPLVKGNKQVLEVSNRWDKALVLAKSLLKEQPDSLEVKALLGDLLRMGHNIDVPRAAYDSSKILNEVLEEDPHYLKAHLALAYLYVTISPEWAAIAEHHFLQAEALASPEVIPDIYQGLGFAALYQERTPEAIRYFEKYLKMRNVPHVRELLTKLKAGKKGQVIQK